MSGAQPFVAPLAISPVQPLDPLKLFGDIVTIQGHVLDNRQKIENQKAQQGLAETIATSPPDKLYENILKHPGIAFHPEVANMIANMHKTAVDIAHTRTGMTNEAIQGYGKDLIQLLLDPVVDPNRAASLLAARAHTIADPTARENYLRYAQPGFQGLLSGLPSVEEQRNNPELAAQAQAILRQRIFGQATAAHGSWQAFTDSLLGGPTFWYNGMLFQRPWLNPQPKQIESPVVPPPWPPNQPPPEAPPGGGSGSSMPPNSLMPGAGDGGSGASLMIQPPPEAAPAQMAMAPPAGAGMTPPGAGGEPTTPYMTAADAGGGAEDVAEGQTGPPQPPPGAGGPGGAPRTGTRLEIAPEVNPHTGQRIWGPGASTQSTSNGVPIGLVDGKMLWDPQRGLRGLSPPPIGRRFDGTYVWGGKGVEERIEELGKGLTAEGEKAEAAFKVLMQTEQIRQAFNKLQASQHGWMQPGPGLPTRMDLYRAYVEIGRLVGGKDWQPGVSEQQAEAAYTELSKLQTTLGFSGLTQYFGFGREALGAIQTSLKAVPGVENTFLSGQVINRFMEVLAQRQIDRYTYRQKFFDDNAGNLNRADVHFDRQHSVQAMTYQVLSEFGLGPDGFGKGVEGRERIRDAVNRGYLTERQAEDILSGRAARIDPKLGR